MSDNNQMQDQTIDAAAAVMRHTEAPYSFNVKAFDPSGFDVMFTIRDEDGTRFMTRVTKLRAWMVEAGYTSSRVSAPTAAATNGSGPEAGAPTCQYHGPMKRSQKFAGWYCPSKMGDGSYCKESVKD